MNPKEHLPTEVQYRHPQEQPVRLTVPNLRFMYVPSNRKELKKIQRELRRARWELFRDPNGYGMRSRQC